MDVIIDNAGSKSSSSKPALPAAEQQSGSEIPTTDAEMQVTDSGTNPSEAVTGSKVEQSAVPSVSGASDADNARTVLLRLPQADLRLLCSLLATEGYFVLQPFNFCNDILILFLLYIYCIISWKAVIYLFCTYYLYLLHV